MRLEALVCVLTLMAPDGVIASPAAAPPSAIQVQPPWHVITSRHFDVHYLPEMAPGLDRVVRAAERAYRRISERLHFDLPTRVPVVLWAPSGSMPRAQVVTYATSDAVAPPQPHRSRIVLPVSELDAELDTRLLHELTHLLVLEIISPGVGGDGGLPRWVNEGIANYMAGTWSEGQDRQMRELVASGDVPALSQLTGSADPTNPGLDDALGHAVFDYIESRWGQDGVRRFVNALALPRAANPFDVVFGQASAELDAGFRQYMQSRFGPGVR